MSHGMACTQCKAGHHDDCTWADCYCPCTPPIAQPPVEAPGKARDLLDKNQIYCPKHGLVDAIFYARHLCPMSDCEHEAPCTQLVREVVGNPTEGEERMASGLRRWCEAFQALIPEEAKERVEAQIEGLRAGKDAALNAALEARAKVKELEGEVSRLREVARELDECFQKNILQSYGTRGSVARNALREVLGAGDDPEKGEPRMICNECQKEGLQSKVFPGHGSCTLMGVYVFFDEGGKKHVHDPNITTMGYSCSNGHKWAEKERRTCWCEASQVDQEGTP